jgi:hypothetical protein
MRYVVTVASMPVALLIADLAFWYGPSTPVSCGARPAWADHYGHVDGPGGPGFKGCLAPSTANYVLTAAVFVGTLLLAAVTDLVRRVPRSGSDSPRGRIYLDAAGNRITPPAD